MYKRALIYAGGDRITKEGYCNFLQNEGIAEEECLKIAADSGMELARELGTKCDIWAGDFDSSADEPEKCNDMNCEIERHPVRKDDTDLMLAIKIAMKRGIKDITIFGATGKRLDHTFAAIQALNYVVEEGGSARIIAEDTRMMVVKEGEYSIGAQEAFTFSLFALSEKVKGLSIEGTEYDGSLDLTYTFPIGVSNKILERAVIKFESGRLLIICSKE